jgi:hypothetical protein
LRSRTSGIPASWSRTRSARPSSNATSQHTTRAPSDLRLAA